MVQPLTREQRGMLHLAYEVEMCAVSALRMLTCVDQMAVNAYLECMLLHARALEEFLVLPPGRRSDDMNRTDFAADWTAVPTEAVNRLGGRRSIINKHLAHLTWARVDDAQTPSWPYNEIADDVTQVAHAWVEHVTSEEGKQLTDPDIKALPLWEAVKMAEGFLARVPRTAHP